jgi:prepilin-type N-terminal cleavage/methylation domain-containing protein
MHARKRQSGFTLIEVLLALSILSIIMVLVLGAMRIGVRAWEKGEDMLATQQRSRTVLDLLTRQVTSASVLMSIQNRQPLVEFAGGTRVLEFTSSLPLINRMQYGPVHVRYVIENYRGAVLVSNRFFRIRRWRSGNPGFRWRPPPGWTASWHPEKPTDLPRAVRITFRDEKGGHDLRVIAPIYQSKQFFDAKGNNV